MQIQEAFSHPKSAKRPVWETLPYLLLHVLGVYKVLQGGAPGVGWGGVGESVGLSFGCCAGQKRLQPGSGIDPGESSHMALMKSTTSLPPPPQGPSSLQLMQCPGQIIVFFPP